jgi:hypothetical protein
VVRQQSGNARPDVRRFDKPLSALDIDRKPHEFKFGFRNDAGESVITGRHDELGNWISDNADPLKVTATVRWQDANGNRWRRSNRGFAERLRR